MNMLSAEKMYPCWRTYRKGEKLPVVMFHNGRRIDLASEEVAEMLAKLHDNEMLMFYEHLFYGSFLPCSGDTQYIFGSNFSVTKNSDDSVCIFGNGCLFE